MRVIVGKLKGRKITSVPGSFTRPTSDKIKEAVFHIMGPYFQGGYGLDLFAGSGALGIEAISRGMDRVIFIDNSSLAVRTIKKNIKTFQIENQAEVYQNNAYRALKVLTKKDMKFDLIILDPPYEKVNYSKLVAEVASIAKESCFIYVEHPPRIKIAFHQKIFRLFYQKDYSSTISVTILQYSPCGRKK